MGELLKQTLELARRTEIPVDRICQGARVKERWYFRFVAGDFEDPGVNKVERVHRFLKKHNGRQS